MFIQVETIALTIGVAAATAGVFFCCNLMYLHCFLESESEEQQEFGKEEEEDYYEMKLMRKKDKWERKLKKIRDVYREDRSKWEEDNRNLATKLLTATATSELYRALIRDIHSYF
ncbi:hypothetical protein QYF36_019389 [Acer negundo]|nr:hypothetical protein QYF36_019389 [Acer negundo]